MEATVTYDARPTYEQFLSTKIVIADRAGFDIDPARLHPSTFPHQRDAILWAARLGRALIAMRFGLGKTHIAIELARAVHEHTGKPFLVVCPLGVRHQFVEEDGRRLGVHWHYVRTDAEIEAADTPFLITNYERVRDGDIDPRRHDLGGVNLDEGSVMRSLGSKTYQVFIHAFENVPFRFICTATPAPNQYRELIYYAQFLGIMDAGQALTRWFQRDTSKAGNLTLHPQHERDFWLWVASWALFLYQPSDLGHSDDGYELPELSIHWHRIAVDHRRAWEQTDNYGQHRLFLDAASGVREATAEKRATMSDRIAKALDIVQEARAEYPDDQWVIWCHLNPEQEAAVRALREAGMSISSIYGALDIDETERRLYEWKDGSTLALVGKPVMLGAGLNLQQSHRMIYVGVDFKFADFIQALHRVYRFLQLHPVDVHIIYAASEDKVVATLKRKWAQHDKLVGNMQAIIRKYGLAHAAIRQDLARTIGVARQEYVGRLFTAVLNDCTLEIVRLADDSVDLVTTSIPFGNHFEYTALYNDYGHNRTDGDFWHQMDYLIPHLLRVLKPGRCAAIHVKDRILYGHQTPHGFMEVEEFSDDCVKAFKRHGFMYEGRRTIVTDVVRENSTTYRLGWSEVCKDSSKMGCGLPEYVLLFRKQPSSPMTQYADEPVVKVQDSKNGYSRARWQLDAHDFWRSNGNRPLLPDELYDYEAHVAELNVKELAGNLPSSWFYHPPASPHPDVWTDIVFMRSLNSEQSRKRQENHLCPLPFDVVERIIRLYSNEGDLVLDPFAGLFTVVERAVRMGRRGYGIELAANYYADGLYYCKAAELAALTPTLFDWLKQQAGEGEV